MKILDQFMINRIEDISDDLRQTNSKYYRAVNKRKELSDVLNKFTPTNATEDVILSVADIKKFNEMFEQELTVNSIFEQELYMRGYVDCIAMLKDLGVIL